MSSYLCPVCGYGMEDEPANYNICPSCGTEFGHHDANASIEELRNAWIKTGPRWWSATDQQPENWNPFLQLANLGLVSTVISTSSAYSPRLPAGRPRLVSGTEFQVEPKPDYFDWAGRAWGQAPSSEDTQPASV